MKRTALFVFFATVLPAQQYFTGQAARILIGQPVWSMQSEGASDRLLGSISGVAFANGNLYVADSNRLGATPNNNRIMVYGNIASVMPGLRDELPVNDAVRCATCLGVATNVLGQVDFNTVTTDFTTVTPANNQFRVPTGIAANSHMLAIADTDNNRVLIWKSLPQDSNTNQPADLVIGQPDFASHKAGLGSNKLQAPAGLWLDSNDGLWVADAGNNRVLYYGVPTKNGQDAILVLGQPDLNTDQQPKLVNQLPTVSTSTMLTPMSVTTDGVRLYVADMGFNRVLIWNSIPKSNAQAADVIVGQPDTTSWAANNSSNLCESNGTDSTTNNPTYPQLCDMTIS